MSSFSKFFLLFSWVVPLHESPSAAVCFFPGICQTSKLNKRIQAVYCVNKALSKSLLASFSCATSTFVSDFKIKWILYNQCLTFFKAFKTPQHSHFVASYVFSVLFQISDLYLIGCFLNSTSWLSVAPHLSPEESTPR